MKACNLLTSSIKNLPFGWSIRIVITIVHCLYRRKATLEHDKGLSHVYHRHIDMEKRKCEFAFAVNQFDSRKKTTVEVDQSSSPFLTLPVELVYRILDNLDELTILCSARNVCVRLNTITDAYHRYQAPTALNLSSSQIGNKKAQLLADALRNNTTLTTLDLWENLIGETGAQHLADALRINTTLTTLNLGRNCIGNRGVQHLADALKNNTTLTTLNLYFNQIGDTGAQHLVDTLRINTTLTTLNLGRNNIGDQWAKYLADALKNSTTLTSLNLNENKPQVSIKATRNNQETRTQY
ncbi:unnamed protein product [Rotaria socialis]